jgi:hypothetical protein
MNAPLTLQRLWANVMDQLKAIRKSRFAADRLSVALLIVALILNALALFAVGARVRPTDVPVPVHFSSLNNFDALGSWYFPFEIVAFGFVVTIINGFFAYSSYLRSRLASFFLLTGAIVVAIFTLIIANAFSMVAPQ